MFNAKTIAFVLYFIVVLLIGVYFFIKTRGGNEKDYFLGGRKMNSWVTALSAQASDMSAWLLMGLPGSIWALGVGQIWIAVGLLIGTILNWIFTAPRLRAFSKEAGDSITIPEYLSNRFLSKSNSLRVICAIVFFVCYAVYTASSFKACGTVFNNLFGIDPSTTVTIYAAAVIILLYTFMGGFNAVCWTDFFQGMLMLAALMAAPIVGYIAVNAGETGSIAGTAASAIGSSDHFWNLLPTGKFDWESVSVILSGLGWGLGYFGMPHILVRFMSIKSVKAVKRSRNIAIVWIILALCAAVTTALVGALYLPTMDKQENVFINMATSLFPAAIAGLLLSAVVAASMSTADSQLLVSSSSFTTDIYKAVINKKASSKELMWVGRIVVIVIAIVAVIIAVNPATGGIMDLVENAWAGFGSAFGPVIILSLFWKRFTYKGAVAGIAAGAVTDVLWLIFLSDPTGIYEIIPGFIVSMIAAVIVTLADKKPSEEINALFDRSVAAVKANSDED